MVSLVIKKSQAENSVDTVWLDLVEALKNISSDKSEGIFRNSIFSHVRVRRLNEVIACLNTHHVGCARLYGREAPPTVVTGKIQNAFAPYRHLIPLNARPIPLIESIRRCTCFAADEK
jgi:hypothetical protein